jgi:putative ABC transport system permease protein
VDGTEVSVAGVDPATIGEVYSPDSTIELTTLSDAILVRSSTLLDWEIAVGDTIELTLPEGVETFEIAGTIEEASLGNVLMSTDRFNAGFGETESDLAFAQLAGSVSIEDGFAATETALSDFATVDIYTKADQIAEAESMVDQMVNLFTGLLGLAMLIAVLGIANTLALSVVERTREIGLLRAVGMNRRQVRAMIRWEAVMIAVFGATLGVVVGTGLGASMVATLADDGLGSIAIPGVQLAVWVAAGGLAGVVAAFFPARSAARLDVLNAISYE